MARSRHEAGLRRIRCLVAHQCAMCGRCAPPQTSTHRSRSQPVCVRRADRSASRRADGGRHDRPGANRRRDGLLGANADALSSRVPAARSCRSTHGTTCWTSPSPRAAGAARRRHAPRVPQSRTADGARRCDGAGSCCAAGSRTNCRPACRSADRNIGALTERLGVAPIVVVESPTRCHHSTPMRLQRSVSRASELRIRANI